MIPPSVLTLGTMVSLRHAYTFILNHSMYVSRMSQTNVHPSAESGFSTPQLYDRARPSYSKEAVSFLLDKLDILPQNPAWDQPIRILELGTGTGKFTRILQEVLHGSNVQIIASEPLLSMREQFRKNVPDIEIKVFSAENIDLPDSSVHAVIAAQSFHWFANDESISQIQRVLVPGGKLGLIWNSWDDSVAWVKEVHEEITLPLYRETNTPNRRTYEWKKVLDTSGKFGPLEGNETQFKYEQAFLTFDEFLDRIMSHSVIAGKNEGEKELIKDKVKLTMSKHNKLHEDTIILPYRCQIYWCERK